MNYNWNWHIFWEASPDGSGTYLDVLLNGLQWTLATSLLAAALAFLFGSVIGVMRTTPSRTLRAIGTVYVELFRNIPLLVQMFLWYFVLPELLPSAMGNWVKAMAPPWASFFPAVTCLAFFTSARVAEQVRAGIESLSSGQRLAGLATGLTLAQTYRYILLPVVYRIITPTLTSELMNVIKNSSVALTISLVELTSAARSMQEFSFQVFEAFTAATLIYVFINVVVVIVMRILEKKTTIPGFFSGETDRPVSD
ncbi:MAG: amino acid ABC transporter permease [Burkholderiales bacterium]|jgi:glutamate/aspartate transport system permease protein|nr:amino acid ABC transporter permease [Burkholderiales bacterium]